MPGNQCAVAIADADGLDAVTIRAVAARIGASAMSLYSYVPDKQALVHDMVEHVSGELGLPAAPSGDWRADMHALARQQRDMTLRHPWLIAALSHRQPLGPATLAYLEFGLGALEPTGLSAGARLETIALINGFVVNLVRAELADSARDLPDPDQTARYQQELHDLLISGRYPRFAAAVQQAAMPAIDLAEQFDRLLDRLFDGLVPHGTAPVPGQ